MKSDLQIEEEVEKDLDDIRCGDAHPVPGWADAFVFLAYFADLALIGLSIWWLIR